MLYVCLFPSHIHLAYSQHSDVCSITIYIMNKRKPFARSSLYPSEHIQVCHKQSSTFSAVEEHFSLLLFLCSHHIVIIVLGRPLFSSVALIYMKQHELLLVSRSLMFLQQVNGIELRNMHYTSKTYVHAAKG